MKIFLMLLLMSCSSVIVKHRIVKEEVVSIHDLKTGSCEYATNPKSYLTILTIDDCGKYVIGDTLQRIEEYRVKK